MNDLDNLRNLNDIKAYASSVPKILEQASIALWEMELPSGKVKFNRKKTDVLGYDNKDFNNYQDFMNIVHPDDYDKCMKAMMDHIEGRKEKYDVSYRIKKSTGEYLWFHDIGKIVSKSNEGKIIIEGCVLDISSMMDAERKLAFALDNVGGVFLECNLETNILSIPLSHPYQTFLDYEETFYKNLTIEKFAELIHPFDQRMFYKQLESLKAKILLDFQLELRLKKKNGDFCWFQSYGIISEYFSNGAPKILSFHFFNINENRNQEIKIQDSEEKFKLIAENTSDGLLFVENNKIKYVSPSYLKLFGHSFESFKNLEVNDFNQFIHPDDLEEVLATVYSAIEKKVTHLVYSYRVRKSTNEYIWKEDHTTLQYSEDGNWIRAYIVARDITESRLLNLELKKLSQAVHQSSAMVMITNKNGIIEYTNPKFTAVTGYDPEEIIGKSAEILNSGLNPSTATYELWANISAGKEWSGEFVNRKKDGTIYYEKNLISPIIDENGKITHFVAIKEDISERKTMIDQLNTALIKVKESDRVKSSLLANMSHEYRTPMNGILGLSEVLTDLMTGEEEKEILRKIIDSGKRLMTTLDSVLELAGLESADASKIMENEVCVNDLIVKIFDEFQERAQQKQLLFNISIEKERFFVRSGEKYISLVFNHIIDNAIKYCDFGEVSVDVKLSVIMDVHYLVFTCKDTGIGISQATIKNIFEDFRQESEGFGRKYEGIGIGLSLVKKIVAKLGGSISVTSKIDKGSAFTVQIPAFVKYSDKDKGRFASDTNIAPSLKPNVLIVEDNLINAQLIGLFLKMFCFTSHAKDCKSAIQSVKQNKYDIILMDINLGADVDGVETARQIKEIAGYENVPVVAVTSYAMTKDKEYFAKQGIPYYLPKPFTKQELIELIENILDKKLT